MDFHIHLVFFFDQKGIVKIMAWFLRTIIAYYHL